MAIGAVILSVLYYSYYRLNPRLYLNLNGAVSVRTPYSFDNVEKEYGFGTDSEYVPFRYFTS